MHLLIPTRTPPPQKHFLPQSSLSAPLGADIQSQNPSVPAQSWNQMVPLSLPSWDLTSSAAARSIPTPLSWAPLPRIISLQQPEQLFQGTNSFKAPCGSRKLIQNPYKGPAPLPTSSTLLQPLPLHKLYVLCPKLPSFFQIAKNVLLCFLLPEMKHPF